MLGLLKREIWSLWESKKVEIVGREYRVENMDLCKLFSFSTSEYFLDQL